MNFTIVVIIISLLVAYFLGLFDFIFTSALEKILQKNNEQSEYIFHNPVKQNLTSLNFNFSDKIRKTISPGDDFNICFAHLKSIVAKQEIKPERNWYAIHTYAGYENAVMRNLKQRIDSLGVQEKIFNVIVPTEKRIKIKGGKRVEKEEKIYPGYVLVDMVVTDDSWYVVRNTPRVTGFVGTGVNPVPLSKDEVDLLFKKMNADVTKHKIDLQIDETVLITDGPFKEMEGKVSEIDQEHGKIKVLVAIFGRETPVELDFLQVKKI